VDIRGLANAGGGVDTHIHTDHHYSRRSILVDGSMSWVYLAMKAAEVDHTHFEDIL